MGRKLKPFVDKKGPNTYSFRLVHRSQHDPLIADEESSRHVLMQVAPPNSKPEDMPAVHAMAEDPAPRYDFTALENNLGSVTRRVIFM